MTPRWAPPSRCQLETAEPVVATTVADVLRAHDIPEPETAARDLTALTRGMIDAAGLFGETEIASLEQRVQRAVYGYLRLD
ncbi:hypothetical protein V5F72_11760 [Xanthobacter flavus]|uniref:hypothetical protein n=1 Tax=Xanthobacter flavus TaxID=281 RepID=UPI003727A694